jgi:hypothetical protein
MKYKSWDLKLGFVELWESALSATQTLTSVFFFFFFLQYGGLELRAYTSSYFTALFCDCFFRDRNSKTVCLG